MCVSLIN